MLISTYGRHHSSHLLKRIPHRGTLPTHVEQLLGHALDIHQLDQAVGSSRFADTQCLDLCLPFRVVASQLAQCSWHCLPASTLDDQCNLSPRPQLTRQVLASSPK